ncbi:hypothetical protein Bbelb_204030 [Branchiostoma belcheri]|nr:hypothetical protein Bbelb_204030 [Branchiostoma belcheri]
MGKKLFWSQFCCCSVRERKRWGHGGNREKSGLQLEPGNFNIKFNSELEPAQIFFQAAGSGWQKNKSDICSGLWTELESCGLRLSDRPGVWGHVLGNVLHLTDTGGTFKDQGGQGVSPRLLLPLKEAAQSQGQVLKGVAESQALKPSDQSKKTQKCKPLTNKNKANITIPYVQGVSEKLRRIFQNFNIATYFKPHSTLRQRLVHPKDRPHKGTKANVIYRLKCEEPNCNNTYIGETSRPLKVRYKEHCRPSANGYSSAIFHHLQHNQGHSFKLESTDVLDRETRWWERGVKEAIYERMYNPTLNREGGLRVDLSGTWDLALPAPRTDNT